MVTSAQPAWIVRYSDTSLGSEAVTETTVFAASAGHAVWEVAGSFSEGWIDGLEFIDVRKAEEKPLTSTRRSRTTGS